MLREVLLNGRFCTQPVTGVQRFAWEMFSALRKHSPGLVSEVALPGDAPPDCIEGPLPTVWRGRTRGHLWEQTELPLNRSGRFLLNLCNAAPASVRDQLVVLHDVAFLKNERNFSRSFSAWYRFVVGGYIRRGARVATVSKFSASEISKAFDLPLGEIRVLSEGSEHVLRHPADTSLLRAHSLEPGSYVLAVSSNVPNKNFAAVASAANLLRSRGIPFVVAGSSGQGRVFASASFDKSTLVHVGFVSDAQLRGLFENAACFVFPSFYEGFGLPALEAMACGCPVVAANTSSIPEVCGDAALLCDPHDVAGLARQILRIVESRSLQQELREAGLRRAVSFSWQDAARRLIDACPQ